MTNGEKAFWAKYRFIVMSLLLLTLIFLDGYLIQKLLYVPKEEIRLKEDGYAVTSRTMLLSLLRQTTDAESYKKINKVFQKLEEDEVIVFKDGTVYYQKNSLDETCPCLQDFGAYLILLTEEATFYTKEYQKIAISGGRYLIDGVVYNKEQERLNNQDLLLLCIGKNLYINLEPMKLYLNGVEVEVDRNTYLLFDETVLYTAVWGNIGIETKAYPMVNASILEVQEKKYFYENYYLSLGSEPNSVLQTAEDSFIAIEDNMFQYVLGQRYDYYDNFNFYNLSDGIYLENNGVRTKLESQPLYYCLEDMICGCYLPYDYMIVNAVWSTMEKLPALTRLEYKGDFVQAYYSDKVKSIDSVFLYNGIDTYLFPSGVTLQWGYKEVVLSPMSSVTVENENTIGVYHYEEGIFTTYAVKGFSIYAKLDETYSIDFSEAIVRKKGVIYLLLGSHPELLPEYK